MFHSEAAFCWEYLLNPPHLIAAQIYPLSTTSILHFHATFSISTRVWPVRVGHPPCLWWRHPMPNRFNSGYISPVSMITIQGRGMGHNIGAQPLCTAPPHSAASDHLSNYYESVSQHSRRSSVAQREILCPSSILTISSPGAL